MYFESKESFRINIIYKIYLKRVIKVPIQFIISIMNLL